MNRWDGKTLDTLEVTDWKNRIQDRNNWKMVTVVIKIRTESQKKKKRISYLYIDIEEIIIIANWYKIAC